MFGIWGITIALFAVVFYLWILKRKRMFSVLKEMGIPGPEPSIFFGNFQDLIYQNTPMRLKEWEKKYGKIFGYYYGCKPVVVVADVELAKKIQISDFHKFINRPLIFVVGDRQPRKDEGAGQLVNLRDKRWKDVRSTITPAFTTSKMKTMVPIINNTIDTFMKKIDEQVQMDLDFDITDMYKALTMDIIGRTSFGIQTDCQTNPDDLVLKVCKQFFEAEMTQKIFVFLFCFPELRFIMELVMFLLLRLHNKGSNPINQLITRMKEIIKARRESGSNRRQDILQQLIDAEVSPSNKNLTAGVDDPSDITTEENTNKKKNSSLQLTEDEVFDNTFLFLLAGFETTSAALAFVTHCLIHFPEVQERVRDEVMELEKKQGYFDYSAVQQLQYMDQVINESLRLFAPVYFFVNREAGEDVVLDNFHIKKGMSIQIPSYEIHMDEEYWPNPETFDPDRFAPENKDSIRSGAFQAFGVGPRNCVGMRLALMQMKFALARILRKYRLTKCEKTDSHPPTFKVSMFMVSPKNGIHLKAVPL